VALLLRALQARQPALRVGIIGLGAGVLASFCRPPDSYVFYEIDPLIEAVARSHFAFLGACRAGRVALGDARLVLQQRAPEGLDALVIDAFSGDAVPVHLLTAEAFRLFATHLREGGVLSLHVSNRFLDLEPVVAASAQALGRAAFVVNDDGDADRDLFSTRWMIVAEPQRLAALGLLGPRLEPVKVPRRFRAWTDDYSNLAERLRTD
jgi:spermidine synthase